MKGEQDQNEDVQHGVPVQAERPVGFLVFCEEKKTGEDLDAEQNDQGHAADAVKEPDEHTPPCLMSRKQRVWMSTPGPLPAPTDHLTCSGFLTANSRSVKRGLLLFFSVMFSGAVMFCRTIAVPPGRAGRFRRGFFPPERPPLRGP